MEPDLKKLLWAYKDRLTAAKREVGRLELVVETLKRVGSDNDMVAGLRKKSNATVAAVVSKKPRRSRTEIAWRILEAVDFAPGQIGRSVADVYSELMRFNWRLSAVRRAFDGLVAAGCFLLDDGANKEMLALSYDGVELLKRYRAARPMVSVSQT